MPIFNDYDLNTLLNSQFSYNESLNDISSEDEDKDKIFYNLLQMSKSIQLRVDYSDFNNHIFFGSANASVNFALSRLFNDYPIYGELKEVNEWKKINSGYENWFFDNFPKNVGFVNFVSSSTPTFVTTDDYQGYVTNLGTSSFTVEFLLSASNKQNNFGTIFKSSDLAGSSSINIYCSSSFYFTLTSGGTTSFLVTNVELTGAAHHIACVYSYPEQRQYIYVDNILAVTASKIGRAHV